MNSSLRYTAADPTATLPADDCTARFRDAERIGGHCRFHPDYGRGWGCSPFGFRAEEEYLAWYDSMLLGSTKITPQTCNLPITDATASTRSEGDRKRIRAVFNWSGGKDSAHALLRAQQSDKYEIVALLTTVNRATRRSTMHGIPLPLLQAQADSIGIPLHVVDLTPKGNMEDYGAAMSRAVVHFKAQGVTHFIFGDIHLHDVRKYREDQLAPHGIDVVEPLWGKTSGEVIADFLKSGLRTVVVTTMADGLGAGAIGREINREFIDSLPNDVDPNGENGEYHTFCYDGPIFRNPIPFRLGEPFSQSYDIPLDNGTVKTYSYWFADLKER